MNSGLMSSSSLMAKSLVAKTVKPRILVVDDEPDNLDLLYRTFRRDFQVLRAASGKEALAILAEEGEVAIIISDQRMPEMKGTEFLSKTVPQFPDTVRIILTGFTDVEDLVEAINAGQVYRYITKPWDPDELKQVVQRAAETYELLKQRTDEMLQAHTQALLLSQISEIAEESATLEIALNPIAAAFAEAFKADHCILRLAADEQLTATLGTFGPLDLQAELDQTPLLARLMATKQVQVLTDTSVGNAGAASASHAGIAAQVLAPVLYREQVIAVLMLQWKTDQVFSEGQQEALRLAIRHLTLALLCLQS
ncbi:MAG TPA: response regulator [Trichocoleus sp.]